MFDLHLPPAARVGDPLSAVDTPALVLDLDAFERNLDLMQSQADAAGLALRPHAKAHKTPAVALAQIARGAVGVCCQKVSEALPFLRAGVQDIHISNEVVSQPMLALLAQMARHGRFSVCVDHPEQIAALADAVAAEGSHVDVFIEIDIGQGRCGVADGEAALRLLERLDAHTGRLSFKGLQAYQGRVQHIRSHAERRQAVQLAAARTAAVLSALSAAGVPCPVVTGGGSGSVEFDLAGEGVYTELQPGSYAFMDADYGRNEYVDRLRFEHSLFIHSRVMSRTGDTQAIVDAGLKSMSAESGLPLVFGREGLEYAVISDEHGSVRGAPLPALGEGLLLVPGHCDPTFNLHDELVCLRGGVVEAIWPVAARGLSR